MTVTLLHYDILLGIIPFLPPLSIIEYATTCRQLCQPALRQLWNSPIITTPQSFKIFMQSLISSILSSSSSSPRLYHHWITKLSVTFQTFQPISMYLLHILEFNKLKNLTDLSLHNTYATLFSSTIQFLHLDCCILKSFPITNNNINNINDKQHNQTQILSNIQTMLNHHHHQEDILVIGSSSPFIQTHTNNDNQLVLLPLTDLSIMNSTIYMETNNNRETNTTTTAMQLSDNHLQFIAKMCPQLRQCRVNGFFSDEGITHLANHCRQLEEIYLALPNNLAQSNTITHTSIKELAIKCPKLRKFSCFGQTRINPQLAKETFHLYCPHFISCNVDIIY